MAWLIPRVTIQVREKRRKNGVVVMAITSLGRSFLDEFVDFFSPENGLGFGGVALRRVAQVETRVRRLRKALEGSMESDILKVEDAEQDNA